MELSQRRTTKGTTFDLTSLKPSLSSSSQLLKIHRRLLESQQQQLQHMEIKPYKCSYSGCLFSTIHKQNLQRHESVHSQGKRFACEVCQDYRATTKFTVLKHMRSCHDTTSTNTPIHLATCPAARHRHKNLGSSTSKNHNCTCGSQRRSSKSKKSMDLNQRRNPDQQQQSMGQMGGGKNRCPVCSWNIKTNFERHLQSHLEQKPFKCAYNGCTFATKHKQNMDRHEIVHTKEKRFACDFCEYRATTRYTVVKHMKSCHDNNNSNSVSTVTGVNPHQTLSHSHSHSISHQNKGGHSHGHNSNTNNNTTSSSSTSISNNLSRLQQQQQHSERTFKCQLCKYQGKSEGQLARHLSMKSHHNHHQPPSHQDKSNSIHQSITNNLNLNVVNTSNPNNNINLGQVVNNLTNSIPGISIPGNRHLPGVGVVDAGTFAGFSSAAAAVTLCNVPYYYPYGVGKPYG